jgi:Xaa-Pro aminopeptidase
MVVTMLDEVAWLLNMRGNDVPHSPVAYAYVVVELETASLFVDDSKVTPEVLAHLNEAGVSVKPYTSLVFEIKRLAAEGAKLWLDSSRVSVAIKNAFDDACAQYYEDLEIARSKKRGSKERLNTDRDELDGPAALHRPSPVGIAKAIKNEAELEGMRQAHLRDAAALSEFWAWLESEIVDEKKKLSEVRLRMSWRNFGRSSLAFWTPVLRRLAGLDQMVLLYITELRQQHVVTWMINCCSF